MNEAKYLNVANAEIIIVYLLCDSTSRKTQK